MKLYDEINRFIEDELDFYKSEVDVINDSEGEISALLIKAVNRNETETSESETYIVIFVLEGIGFIDFDKNSNKVKIHNGTAAPFKFSSKQKALTFIQMNIEDTYNILNQIKKEEDRR